MKRKKNDDIDLTEKMFAEIQAALKGESDCTLDTMTIIVKGNGAALHEFVYSLARDARLTAAKPLTWKYMPTHKFKVGQVVTFLCLCSIYHGFKKLVPVMVLEISDDERRAIAQSSLWNHIKVQKGEQALLEAALKYMEKKQ